MNNNLKQKENIIIDSLKARGVLKCQSNNEEISLNNISKKLLSIKEIENLEIKLDKKDSIHSFEYENCFTYYFNFEFICKESFSNLIYYLENLNAIELNEMSLMKY